MTHANLIAAVEKALRGVAEGPAAIHFCPVAGCYDLWESEPTCGHHAHFQDLAALLALHTPETDTYGVTSCVTCLDGVPASEDGYWPCPTVGIVEDRLVSYATSAVGGVV